MPIFIDPTGQPTFGIGICGRCNEKFPLADLYPDPNTPGLMVCEKDRDLLDPYRLPFNPGDLDITLPFVRPDEPITMVDTPGIAFILATEDGSPIVTEDDEFLEVEGAGLGYPLVELP